MSATWGAEAATVAFGPRSRLRLPAPLAPGRYLARVDTITPVVSRLDGARADYLGRPTAPHLAASLRRLAEALGLRLTRAEIALRIVASATTRAETDLAFGRGDPTGRGAWGRGGKLPGWSGAVVVECNAVARWLLDVAARGWGLGGKVAAGFGRVRVADDAGGDLAGAPPGRSVRPVPLSALGEGARFYVEATTHGR